MHPDITPPAQTLGLEVFYCRQIDKKGEASGYG